MFFVILFYPAFRISSMIICLRAFGKQKDPGHSRVCHRDMGFFFEKGKGNDDICRCRHFILSLSRRDTTACRRHISHCVSNISRSRKGKYHGGFKDPFPQPPFARALGVMDHCFFFFNTITTAAPMATSATMTITAIRPPLPGVRSVSPPGSVVSGWVAVGSVGAAGSVGFCSS